MRRSPLTTLAALVLSAVLGLGLCAVVDTGEGLAHATSVAPARRGERGTASIKLGLNKSMIVELPRPVRDVIVSNPDQIDAVMQSQTRAYLIGKKSGEANILFVDAMAIKLPRFEVTIERDLSALQGLIARLVPGLQRRCRDHRGECGAHGQRADADRRDARGRDRQQLLGETMAAARPRRGWWRRRHHQQFELLGRLRRRLGGAPSRVINMITAEGREQVLLKVSVVEMQRNIIKQFGVDLDALVNSGNFAFAALSACLTRSARSAWQRPSCRTRVHASSARRFPGGAAGTNSTLGVGWQDGSSRVQGVLRRRAGRPVHMLAEPNLTAISGETANFLAGGEFPVPVAQDNSGSATPTITVDFKKFGIGLPSRPWSCPRGGSASRSPPR